MPAIDAIRAIDADENYQGSTTTKPDWKPPRKDNRCDSPAVRLGKYGRQTDTIAKDPSEGTSNEPDGSFVFDSPAHTVSGAA
jgi:hypothetical protein